MRLPTSTVSLSPTRVVISMSWAKRAGPASPSSGESSVIRTVIRLMRAPAWWELSLPVNGLPSKGSVELLALCALTKVPPMRTKSAAFQTARRPTRLVNSSMKLRPGWTRGTLILEMRAVAEPRSDM